MLSDSPLIVVRSKTDLIPPKDLWNGVWALGYQLRWQFGPAWLTSAQTRLLPDGVDVPAGAWIIDLVEEEKDVEGALGYHDETGAEVPFGRVMVKTCADYGYPWTEVLSHEGMEMAADPHVNACAYDDAGKRLIAYEVGDPTQEAYDLGAPYARVTGIVVSDFVKPNYFDPNTAAHVFTSYRGVCKGPFDLGPKGYVLYADALPPEWQQEAGEHADPRLKDLDDRATRRVGLPA